MFLGNLLQIFRRKFEQEEIILFLIKNLFNQLNRIIKSLKLKVYYELFKNRLQFKSHKIQQTLIYSQHNIKILERLEQ